MTVEQLREMHQARPFQPFAIYLADGRALKVEHPEMLAQAPAGRTIGVARPNGVIEIVDLLSVVSLKPIRNGSPRRRRKED